MIFEDHWRSAYAEQWERLHPLAATALCLQADDDSASMSILLQSCGAGWLQQWRLTKPAVTATG